MDSIQSTQMSEASNDIKVIQLKAEGKRKRQCSETPTDGDEALTPPPYKKTTPCDDNDNDGNDDVIGGQRQQQRGESDTNDHLHAKEDVNHHEIEECLFSLVHFCDEVLYEIFKFLDTWSLMTLMNVSKRFQKFVLDRRLWEEIDLCKEPLPLGILEDMLERSHEKTRTIKLRGPSPSQHIEGEIRHFNKTLKNSLTTRCTKLMTLKLFGVTLDFNQLSFKDFPTTLKRLVLNNCHVRVDANRSIFTAIQTMLVNLEELAIEQNNWFDPFYIMPIAKLPVLKYLSLKGCSQMEDFIPYGSIAGRHGFKQLEILDLCETPLNDSDLQCFNTVETLREIYLQCPEEIKMEATLQFNKEATKTDTLTTTEKKLENQEEKPSTSSAIRADIKSNMSSLSSPESQSSNSLSITHAATNGLPKTQNNESASNINETPSTSSSAVKEEKPNLETQPSSENSTDTSASYSNTSNSNNSNAETSQAANDTSNGNGNNPVNVIAVVGSNTPPRSRFLPRPDHIICVDCRNRASPHAFSISLREPRMPLQRPLNPQQSPPPAFEQMMRHNLFWDIINPLGRPAGVGAGGHPLFGEGNDQDHGVAGAGANAPHYPFNIFYNSRPRRSISDRGVCSFGRTREPVHHGVIWIRFNNRPIENRFERFSIRDYKSVTDTSLEHLVLCSPHLVFLDVSGTSVTLKGIRKFKEQKPECKVVAEHLVSTVL